MSNAPTDVQQLLQQLLADGEVNSTDEIGVAPQNGGESNVVGTVDSFLNG